MINFDIFKIPEYVNWNLFGPFLLLVVANFLYGVITLSLKIEKNFVVRIIGEVLTISLIAFFVYVANTNTICQDYATYYEIYNSGEYFKDYGYVWMMRIFQNLGCDYKTFRTYIYAIFYLLMYASLFVFRANKNFVFSLYAIYPWCYHAFQTRTFIGFSIIVFASTFLLLKGKYKPLGLITFSIFTYFAYKVHASNIIYSIFALAIFTIKGKNYIILFVFSICTALLLVYFNGYSIFVDVLPVEIIQKIVSDSQHIIHFPNKREFLFLFVSSTYMLISAYFSYIAVQGFSIKEIDLPLLHLSKKQTKQRNNDINSVTILFFMSICMFCLLVIFTINTDLLRLERNYFLLIFTMISIAMRNARLKALNPFVIASFVFAILGAVVLLNFSNEWEWGGIDRAFWIFFEYPH